MKDNDELIITNDIEEPQAEQDTVESVVKEPQQSFVEALHEQIHEEDAPQTSQKISIIKILGGDFFTAQILRRQIGLMMVILGFAMLYISNRYSCQKSMLEIDNLKKELQDVKYKALSTSSQLTEQSRQSNVLNMLKENHDSILHIADQPPFIIQVPE